MVGYDWIITRFFEYAALPIFSGDEMADPMFKIFAIALVGISK